MDSDWIILPTGKLTYEFIPQKREDYLGHFRVLLIFRVNGIVKKRLWISGYIRVFSPVVVARYTLERHHIIKDEDIEIKEMDLSTLKDVYTNTLEVIGKRTIVRVNKGELLKRRMLEIPPDIKKGDLIRVTTLVEVERESLN